MNAKAQDSTHSILLIETSTRLCSVALSTTSGRVLWSSSYEAFPEGKHAELLAPLVSEAMSKLDVCDAIIKAIAVSAGPGSYTGLRIGASLAKGLAFGLELPLLAIPTLDILVATIRMRYPEVTADSIRPMMDARRMEVYSAPYSAEGKSLASAEPVVVESDSFKEELTRGRVLFAGDGANKCREILKHQNALFLPTNIYPWAAAMAELACSLFERKETVSVAYWEPNYLKEFVAVVGKNKVLK